MGQSFAYIPFGGAAAVGQFLGSHGAFFMQQLVKAQLVAHAHKGDAKGANPSHSPSCQGRH